MYFSALKDVPENYFKLLDTYYDERNHRDTLFWKQIFTYFYANLIVIILPYISVGNVQLLASIPKWLFMVFGLVMSACFLFISIAYTIRLSCINNTIQRMLDDLPEECSRDSVQNVLQKKWQKPFGWQMSKVIALVMLLLLIALNICLFIFT